MGITWGCGSVREVYGRKRSSDLVATLFINSVPLLVFFVDIVMSGSGDNEREKEPGPQDRELAVPVSELKATVSQMLKEALEEQRARPGCS